MIKWHMRLIHGNRSIAFDGGEITYTVLGSGPPLFVVSSGWALESGYLVRGLAPLVEHFTLICIATCGGAHSTGPADEIEMGSMKMADAIDRLRRYLGFATIDVLGHANGGSIAINFAAKYPHACLKLILVDSELTGFPASEARRGAFAKRADKAPASTAKNRSAVSQPAATQVNMLPLIYAETLVLAGRGNCQTRLSIAERIVAGIEGATLIVVEACGPMPWIEQPKLFLGHITTFART